MYQAITKLSGVSSYARFLRQRPLHAIRKHQAKFENLSQRELRQASRTLQFAARAGKPLRQLLPEAFGLLCEATRQTYSMVPYDVQLLGAIGLSGRTIVEMATGEGKTLTALLPLYLRALQGKGAWLATSNDYLAGRDAEFGQPVFERLDMTVGAITEQSTDDQRREAYACDVTYGTAVQFGFDFLRDRAKARFNETNTHGQYEQPVGRGRLFSILVDEADSLLIDEAATPMLIAGSAPPMSAEKTEAYRWAAELAEHSQEDVHFRYKKAEKKSQLTTEGRKWVHQQLPQLDPTAEKDRSELSLVDYYEFAERAITVRRDLLKERNYLVSGEEVLLVDEGTGRIGKGRQWSEGIQQAVQAKEGLTVTLPTGHLAKVTAQSFFLAFEHLSGMTGTAKQAKGELRSNYKLNIREIPTRLRPRRAELPSQAYPQYEPWLSAIAEECRKMRQNGRSVLIGARNVAHSDMISVYLEEHGLQNQLLNARLDEIEAEIIGQAGQPGRITVATNMAGRGTDIKLHPEVREAGGLHVILAGIHASQRIDRQLIGRSGRQGDPGSLRRMLCLQDDLLDEAFQSDQAARMRRWLESNFSEADCLRLFERAQRTIASRNRTSRRAMFLNDKKNLRYLHHAGLDPLLDVPG